MSVEPFPNFQLPKIVVSNVQNENIYSSSNSSSRPTPKCSSADELDLTKEKYHRRVRKVSRVPTAAVGGRPIQCATNRSKLMKARASELIIRIHSRHLKRMLKTRGVKSLQRETQHFVGVTSVNGLLRVYRSRGVFRLFWITVTTVSLLLLLWQITKLVQLYFSRPTASQITFLLNDNGLPFPAVTICSHHPIRPNFVESMMKAMNISQRLLEYIMLSFMDVQQLLSVSNEDELRLADHEWKEFTHFLEPKFTVNGFFWNASAPCEQMLKLCSFGGRAFDCCKYAKGILTDIGKCYQLDLSSTDQAWMRRQVQFGMNNGLQIIVDTHSEQQIDSLVLNAGHPFADTFDSGFRYYVHEQFSMPYLSTEGISVSPGSKVYSAISPTHYILLPHELWGNCSDRWPDDLVQIVADGAADERYSSLKCKTLCRSKYFNELCGCSPFSYNIDEFYSVCTPFEIYKCLSSTLLLANDSASRQSHQQRDEDFSQIIPTCPQCKIECQRWVYHSYNSYTEAFPHKLRPPKPNIVSLNIFFRDMAYTEYQQVQSLSMTEILSDIGGNMGLFLGMSLISLIEFITYICKISWLFFSKKRRDHMLAKQRRDEEKDGQMMGQTVVERHGTENATPAPHFDTLIGKISRRIQQKTARAEKSIFISPTINHQRQSVGGMASTNAAQPLDRPRLPNLKRSNSTLSTVFGAKKSATSKQSNQCRGSDLVGAIIESRLHGNAGKSTSRSSTSSSSEDGTETKGTKTNQQQQQDKLSAAAERKEVELKIDLESNTVMLVGPPHRGRRYSTTAVFSYQAPGCATSSANNGLEKKAW